MAMTPGIVRIAAMSDIHVSKTGQGALASVFAQVSERADVLVMYVIADFVAADGSRIEGTGVRPDKLVPLNRVDLSAGRDAPLSAALLWIERARQGSP